LGSVAEAEERRSPCHISSIMVQGSSSSSTNTYDDEAAGFSFENWHRNQHLLSQAKGNVPLKAMKTGTTIAGVVYADGVVLGADTRATGGSEVADKNCEKIHYLAPNIYCCGAGTAADTEKTTELVRYGGDSSRSCNYGGCGS